MHDDQLIFMISLPRSGSTMLQKILGGHSEIYTRSEPWLMLHPLHALKSKHVQTRYNASLAEAGVRDFISSLPEDGEGFYYQRLRECYLSMYEPYLQSSGKSRFLDKTPRYYEIFDELQRTFPNAKFIILYRNPLAVLASMLNTWVKGRFEILKNYKGDLEEGVEFLSRDFSDYPNTYCIRYEELLGNPEEQVRSLFHFLQLDFEPECIHYGKSPVEQWLYGDPKTVYEKSSPDAAHADGWLNQLSSPESYKLISDYLQQLGRSRFDKLGYDFGQFENLLKEIGARYSHLNSINLSLRDLMRSDRESLEHFKKQISLLNRTISGLQENNKNIEIRFNESHDLLAQKELRMEESRKLPQSKDLIIKDLEALIINKSLRIKECQEVLKEIREEQGKEREGYKYIEKMRLVVEQDLKEKILSTERALEASKLEANNSITDLQREVVEKNSSLKQYQDLIANQEQEITAAVSLAAEAGGQLAVLMSSIGKLKQHRVLLAPRNKFHAYKQLLETNNSIAKMRNSKPRDDISSMVYQIGSRKMEKSIDQE